MKEPTGHRPFEIEDESGLYVEHCAMDGEDWPCPKWRKWTASPEYRLGEIERRLAANEKREAAATRELREAKEKLRRLELLVRGGIFLHALDNGARISESVVRDFEEIDSWHGQVGRIAGPEEYTVTYHGKNRRYRNGRLEEETFG